MPDDKTLHGPLLGKPDSRSRLNTPALILEIDALDRNIQKMADFANEHRISLRPHAKTHKSSDIGLRQMAAGALGLCCAKIGEAEALAEGGISHLHITSPVISPMAIERVVSLNDGIKDLMVVVDHPLNAKALADAASAAAKTLQVIVDVDPGIHRTGVSTPANALALVREIARYPSLRWRGLQFYCGAEQHIQSWGSRETVIRAKTEYLAGIIALLAGEGFEPAIVTGGGTGTFQIDAALGVFTELQVGSYVFMDRQYLECEFENKRVPFENSLFVEARVISTNAVGLITIDSGTKAFGSEAEPPLIACGVSADATFAFMGDEHGAVILPSGARRPDLGEVITLAVAHCDPTVDLYDYYHVVRGATLEDLWPVSARGRSR